MSDSTNVAVGAEPTIEVRGQAPSFDDLEAISAPKPGQETKPEKNAERTKKESIEKEKVSDNTESKQSKKSKDADQESDKEEGEAKDPKRSAESKGTKYIKAKHGDADLDLAAETVIPTKVAGTLENPTLAELQANFSGRVNWDRKFNDLSREKQQFQGTVDQLNTMVTSMLEAAKDDPFKFYDVIAEAVGRDSVSMKLEAVDQQIALAEKLAGMSPEQRKSFRNEMANKFREDSLAHRENKLKKVDEDKRRTGQLAEVQAKYSITPETYAESEEIARKFITDRDPTPEEVVLADRHMMTIKAFEEVNPDVLARSDWKNIIFKFRDEMVANPDFTSDDLKEIITQAFGTTKTSRLAQKVKDKIEHEHGPGRSKPAEKERVLYSFDQL